MQWFVRWFAALSVVLLAAAAGSADLAATLRGQAPAVLLVEPASGGRVSGTEGYADWVAYRDDFRQRAGAAFTIVTLTPTQYRARVVAPHLEQEFAVVFIRQGTALVHDGMVLEPQIYELGTAWLRDGQTTAEAAAYGLREQSFRPH